MKVLPFLFPTVVDGAGGGEAPPAPAPEAAPAPAPEATSPDTSLPTPDQVRDRILTAPVEELAPDDAPYRDIKPVRDDIAALREQYGPLAHLPEAQRQAFIAFAPVDALVATDPAAAADVAVLRAAYPTMSTEDRAVVDSWISADALQVDPAGVHNFFTTAASVIRGDAPPTEPTPDDADGGDVEVDDMGYALDDPDRPMTARELEEKLASFGEEQRQQQALDEQTKTEQQAILAEVRELGYDPLAQDAVGRLRFRMLMDAAEADPDGSVVKAHESVQAFEQRIIDEYVAGKRTDVRPLPPGSGAPASGEQPIVTLEDSQRAARERLEAANRQNG